jgi:hypothetical protein
MQELREVQLTADVFDEHLCYVPKNSTLLGVYETDKGLSLYTLSDTAELGTELRKIKLFVVNDTIYNNSAKYLNMFMHTNHGALFVFELPVL